MQFAQLRRREFITVIGGTAAWPLAAQQPAWMRKIALLVGSPEGQPETTARITAFREGLVSLGWSEGGNIRIDYPLCAGCPPRSGESDCKRGDRLAAHRNRSTNATSGGCCPFSTVVLLTSLAAGAVRK
jgi:hypothetical protein